MSLAGFSDASFSDYGLENYGLASTDNSEPLDWSKYGLLEFGSSMDRPFGMLDGAQFGLAMEYDDDDVVGYAGRDRLVRTKMLEMCPREIAHIRRYGRPRLGAVALADDADVYQWREIPGYGGFFKKLRKKIKRGVRKLRKGVSKIGRGISKAAKKMIKKLPGGKYLVKIYNRVKKVGMKLVKPLKKLLGSKIGKYLAPIAAMIPGPGPVIAGAITLMRKGGKIASTLKKLGVKRDRSGRPIFKSGEQAAAVKKALAMEAKKAIRKQRKKGRRPPNLVKRGTQRHRISLRGYGLEGV